MTKKRSYLRNGLIFLHIVFAILGFYIYIFNYRLSENLLIQKTLSKQAILAKSGSLSVENLLKNVQSELTSFVFTFAKINDSASIDTGVTRKAFIAYMQRAQLPINGIALYDAQGKLSIIENRYDIRIGENQDFSKTAVILWSKNPANRDKTFISTPYIGTTGASIGKIILILAKPIYFGNTYKGTLAIRLLVNEFRNSFVTPLTADNAENSLIINSDGVVLAGNAPLLNQNIFTYAQKQKWNKYNDFISTLRMALQTNTTQATWTFQNPKEKPIVSLVGISRIDIPNSDKDLFMIVTTPQDSTIASLRPVRGYGLVWLGFGVIATIIGSALVFLLQSR